MVASECSRSCRSTVYWKLTRREGLPAYTQAVRHGDLDPWLAAKAFQRLRGNVTEILVRGREEAVGEKEAVAAADGVVVDGTAVVAAANEVLAD